MPQAKINTDLEKALPAESPLPNGEKPGAFGRLNGTGEHADDELWQQQFSDSHDVLESLFDEISEEYRSGKTKPAAE